VADDDFCYLTTTGRRSGHPHVIEIWYAAEGDSTLYLLAGGGTDSDWVRNLVADPVCDVRIGARDAPKVGAHARVLRTATAESERARTLVFDKYQARYGGDLTAWRGRALPVALDLHIDLGLG
jgi:deazaflavin-dependent oxidoreductase (nitroreductase family)